MSISTPGLPFAAVVPLPHETAELFRLMAEEIRECAILLTDPTGHITVWNRAAELMTGYSAAQARGQFLGVLFIEDDGKRDWPHKNLHAAKQLGCFREENWRVKKDGSLFWALISITALRDATGTLLGFSKMILDLTKHKRLGLCLEEKEETTRILEAAHAGTWRLNLATGEPNFSAALLARLGYEPHDLPNHASSWRRLVHEDDYSTSMQRMQTVRELCPAVPLSTELRLCDKAGHCRWYRMHADWRWNELNNTFFLLGIAIDVHEHTVLNRQILDQRTRFAAILDQMPASIVVAEIPEGKVIYQNQVSEHMFGDRQAPPENYLGYTRFNMAHADGRVLDALEYPLARAVHQGQATAAETLIVQNADGSPRFFSVKAAPVRDDDGVARVAVSVMHDIDTLERTQRRLVFEMERAEITLQTIADAVITTDVAGLVVSMNPCAERLTGISEQDARGQPAAAVVALFDKTNMVVLEDPVGASLRPGYLRPPPAPALLKSRDGAVHSVEYSSAPLRQRDNTVLGAVLAVHDVSHADTLMKALLHQATHDAMTGLVNRVEFEARLKHLLDHRGTATGGAASALMYIDLDQFKIINDTCGHSAGDELLRQLADVYCAHVGERDTLARVGGDEFALILAHCSEQRALHVAGKLLEATRHHPYACGEQTFHLGASIGVILIDEDTTSVAQALRLADHACYIAKESGRNRVFCQRQGGAELAQRRNDMYWTTRLGDAFRANQMQLYVQPIFAIGEAAGGQHYEILLRMANDGDPPIMPATFLPPAERYDIMPDVDRWVVEHSLAWLEQHPAHVAKLELCTINLSRRGLADPSFQRYVAARIDASTVPASKLCFEITETGAIANMRNTLSFIQQLKKSGCRFALDDFGTGMASFSYLKQLPVDYVKIDGSFIQAMAHSRIDLEMVRFTNEISHLMGRKTIAEFVTNQATLDLLRDIGVDFAQGFMLGKPHPIAEL